MAEEQAGAARETDGLALAAFVFSLVSLVVPVVMTAVTLVVARRADRRITAAADEGRRGGQLTTAARVISLTWCGLVLAAVGWIALIDAMADDDDWPPIDDRALLIDPDLDRSLDRLRVRLGDSIYPDSPPPVTPVDVVVSEGDAHPGPMRFEEDAVLSYSTASSGLVITVVGNGERQEIARCDEPCDGFVPVGHFQGPEPFDLEIETDGDWYVRIQDAYLVVE